MEPTRNSIFLGENSSHLVLNNKLRDSLKLTSQTKIKKILFGLSDFGGCGLYRGFRPAQFLNSLHPFSFRCFVVSKVSGDIEMLRDFDYFFLNRPHTTSFSQAYLRFIKGSMNLITDWDDWLLGIPSWNSAAKYYNNPNVRSALVFYLHEATAITVSTPYLKELILKILKRQKPIYICPNFIDSSSILPYKEKDNNKQFRIGWIGTNTHLGDLYMIRDIFSKLYRILGKSVKFVFMGFDANVLKKMIIPSDLPPECLEIHGFVKTHSYLHYMYNLNLSVGLFPLVDCDFNNAKSNIRFLELTSIGVPIVASPTATYKETIKDEINGFLAKNEQEWIDKILTLKDEKLAKKIVENARDYVIKKYSENIIDKWVRPFNV